MTQVWKWLPKPHECAVVIGFDAVDAYNGGLTSASQLQELGQVRYFSFGSVEELNAFILGTEIAQGALDSLAVDDLIA